MNDNNKDESYRDKISTIDDDGKRIWLFPKKPKGVFYQKRKYVAYFLLLVLYGMPYIKFNSEPLLLFNVFDRKFIILGQMFAPQDFYIFALFMITLVVMIVLFTVAFGRIFCGWICPQTIFMEMVYRRIEYLIEGDYMAQKKLKKQEWNSEKVIKKLIKHFLFILVALFTVKTFVAYLIGIDETLLLFQTNPTTYAPGFIGICVITFLFYAVFAHFREQVCTTVCPYGRFQDVLLDKNSIVVGYDHVRGEPREKLRKTQERDDQLGDCIDCKQCVQVCPTGIDIRHGTQLECVNCTACIDACDDIMVKINKPKGLIRYTSVNAIENKSPFKFTARMKMYTIVLVLLSALLTTLTFTRSDTSLTITRVSGQTFQRRPNHMVSNLYRLVVKSKTLKNVPIQLQMNPPESGTVETVDKNLTLDENGKLESILFIVRDEKNISKRREKLEIQVIKDDKILADKVLSFISPRQ